MKRDSLNTNSGSQKSTDAAHEDPAVVLLGKPQDEKRPDDAPPPPPVWTRYIDSRLKQFCTR